MAQEFETILKDLKNKVYHPVYFLHGEEPYFIDQISDYIAANVLSEQEKEFNQTILYGKEVDALTLISYAKRFPMMSNYQVIIVKEAQDIKNTDTLIPYLQNPLTSTLLVFCHKHKTIDGRTSFSKTLKSGKTVLFESKKIYDNKIPAWITGYLAGKKFTINPKAGYLVAEYLGSDLSKIANELDKLMLNVPASTEISVKHIEDYIGISKDFNVFELQSALGKKDVLKANRIVNYFSANPKDNPLVLTIGTLFSYFSKLLLLHTLADRSKNNVASELKVNPFFVGEYESAAKMYPPGKLFNIIHYLREYDLKSKGIDNASAGEGELLKELVYKILH